MTTDIRTLGQLALRRLGVRIVPLDDSPTLIEMVPVADIATGALIELGVVNADGSSPSGAIVTIADIATQAFVELGVLNSLDPKAPGPVVSVSNIGSAALQELGVIAADETASAVDQGLAETKTEAVHDSLVDHGIAKWLITSIPLAFAEEYIKLTAAVAGSSFGKQIDPAMIPMLEGRIRTGVQVLNNSVAFMQDQANRVHDSLVAHGIASWTNTHIPHAVAMEYTRLTAAYAAPSFGKEVDPAHIAALEAHLRQAASLLSLDQAYMLDKVASVHAALDAQGVVWWSGSAVPRAFAEEYTKLTAAYAAAAFGKQVDPKLLPALEARVRRGAMVLSSDDNAYQAVQGVHDDLVMRGLARWSSQDIPDAVGDAYVLMAANALAPLFDKPAVPRDDQLAEQAIARYIALPSSGEPVYAVYF